jgi:DNA polymerase elongation subunit (family B)
LIASCAGWLLDVSIEQDTAVLWIKTEDRKILRLKDFYQPFFYILPRNEHDGHYLFHILSQQSIVKKVSWEGNKFTNLFSKKDRQKLICVFPESVQYYAALSKKLEKDYRVKQFFNTDLSHIQQYLFHRLKVEPTSKVEVKYDGSRLVKLTKVDESEVSPPPFSILYLSVYTSSGKITLEDSVMMIGVRYEDMQDSQQQREEILFNYKEERCILEEFCKYVQAKDPDIIVWLGDHYANTILDYLFSRTEKHELDLQLGRENNNNNKKIKTLKHPGLQWIKGRLSISSRNDHSSVFDSFGLAGLIERCRFSFLPLDLAAKYGMNRIIDSRNCYELIQKGFIILNNNIANKNHEHIRTIEDLVSRDKGGMILSPQTGLHENVTVLDYDSEYSNLIVNYNLSYETVLSREDKSQNNKGLLPTVVDKCLRRQLYFKKFLKELSEDSKEYLWCQQRIDSLKNVLVSLYGTTGSLWNRYGNVLVFEEINRLSREILIKTKDAAQKLGYELIYADTDSVFIKAEAAITARNAYNELVDTLHKEIGLPISIEHNFKFLVLLPLEANEKIEALKQYYGITHEGKLVVRGIEIRRHDTPNFIKQFQSELLYTLFNCKDMEEVTSKGYENALLLVTKAIDKIMIGGDDITLDDLVISKLLGQDIVKYRSLFPHVSAAIRLSNEDKHPSKGDTIKYIYTNSNHKNPLCRVAPIDSTYEYESGKLDYDKEKYKEMILDAADTVLGYFGFDRTVYGNKKNTAKRKWRGLEELRQEREKDIRIEMMDRKQ